MSDPLTTPDDHPEAGADTGTESAASTDEPSPEADASTPESAQGDAAAQNAAPAPNPEQDSTNPASEASTGNDAEDNEAVGTDAAPEAEDDPQIQSVEELEPAGDESSDAPESTMQWFVLKVISNREKSVKEAIERRIRREGLDEFFDQVVIPVERSYEKTKTGKKRLVERKLYPGYMMVRMELNEDTWYAVRDTNGVGDFAGSAGKPIPMEEDEVNRMLGHEVKAPTEEGTEDSSEATESKINVKIPFQNGDTVKINDGSFVGFEGVVTETDATTGKIKVEVTILGQPTDVELEYYQVQSV